MSTTDRITGLQLNEYNSNVSNSVILINRQVGFITRGMFRVDLSFFERFDRGAHVTRVTMPTARYLALGKFLKKLLRIESHHHDNGNVLNRTSMGIDLFNTYLSDEI
jgi:hypothetical protein